MSFIDTDEYTVRVKAMELAVQKFQRAPSTPISLIIREANEIEKYLMKEEKRDDKKIHGQSGFDETGIFAETGGSGATS